MRTFAAHQVAEPPPAEPADRTTVDRTDVVARHALGACRFARSLGAARELAEDLTQEAFVVAWRKGKQHLPDRALAAFLRRTVRLLWLEQRRGVRKHEAALSAMALRLWEAEVDDDGSAEVVAARACVQQLRGRAARAIELAYRDGASRVEIANALGMQPNGVRTLLARTRVWLEQCIRRNS